MSQELRAWALPARAASLVVAVAMMVPLAVACDRDVEGGEALLQELESSDYRNAWGRAPGWGRRLRGDSPHGTWVDVYINDVMSEAIADNVPLDAWPLESQVVVEGWATEDATEREFLVVMSKPTSLDTWYWAQWGADEALIYGGEDIAHCVRCHEAGEDEVRAFTLPPISMR